MNPFYAYLNRLKLIRRWGLMRNTVPENDMEHSMQCALIAHGLAVIGRERFGHDVNPETVLSLALYHDVGEVITGDLPTPVKYKNPEIKGAYKRIESGDVHAEGGGERYRFAVAFSMYPTTVDQLMAIADAGQIMPPKSTWFEPKLRTGLLSHELN